MAAHWIGELPLLSNRELAAVIILGAVLLAVLLTRGGRRSLRDIGNTLLGKLFVVILAYIAYLTGVVVIASRIGLWNQDLMKDTIVWVAIAGIALFGKFADLGGDPHFFRRSFLRIVGLGAVAEFVLNLVSFPLLVELLLAVSMAFLVMMAAVAAHSADLRGASHVLERLVAFAGFAFAAAVLWKIYQVRGEFDREQLLRSFGMIVWFPLAALPAVYLIALYSDYEQLFNRLRWRANRPHWHARLALIATLHGRVRLVHVFNGRWVYELAQTSSFREARTVVRSFKSAQLVDPRERLKSTVVDVLAGLAMEPSESAAAKYGSRTL
jgi:hypothetical protein